VKRVISIFPIMLVIVLLAALTVYADTPIKYSISDWHIHAIVNLDGSMEVKEYITYEISQEHEGLVRRDIDISRASYMEELKVFEVTEADPEDITKSKVEPYTPVDKSEELGEGTYMLKAGSNADEIQEVYIYIPEDVRERTFVLSYKLLDFAFVYNDTAAIFWSPVMPGYGNGIESIDMRLTFSKRVGIETIHSFVYGALDGASQVLEDGTINITGYKVQPEEFMDITVLFPKSAVNEGRKLIDNDVMQKVLEEEQTKMEEMELLREKREQERRFRTTVAIVVGAAALLVVGLCGCLLFIRQRRIRKDKEKAEEVSEPIPSRHEPSNKGRQLLHEIGNRSRDGLNRITAKLSNKKEKMVFDDLPADYYTPAELSVLLHRRRIKAGDVIATLMDLVRKGYVDLKTVETDGAKHYVFKLKDFEPNSLKAHEEYLVNWFFKDIGDGTEVTSQAIKQAAWASDAAGVFSTKFIIWKKLVLNQAQRWRFYESESVLWWHKRTEFGNKHYKDWRDFREFLKAASNEVNSIPLGKWERYLVYAFPLGIAGRLAQALEMVLNNDTADDDQLTILAGSNFTAFGEWLDLVNSFGFLRSATTRLMKRISSVYQMTVNKRDRTM